MTRVDEYIEQVIRRGDEGSDLLAKKFAPTLKNNNHVRILSEGMNGFNVLEVPEGYCIVVHSAGGNPRQTSLESYAGSLVDNLMYQADVLDVMPIGVADTIDARVADKFMLEVIADALCAKANANDFPILNGELAVLGTRVRDVNLSGTMISTARMNEMDFDVTSVPKLIKRYGSYYGVFDPEGKKIYINSDGVGTKTEFYERFGNYEFSIDDFYAMVLDDASKKGAKAKVISGVLETKGKIPVSRINERAYERANGMGILGILQHEDVGDRLIGYSPSTPSLNVGGSVVSVIDEFRLQNPLKPSPGEYLVAISGRPNPRSNGISSKRKGMNEKIGTEWCKKYGVNEWHNTPEGKIFLEYLASPSVILYPVFEELISKDLAKSVYHPSGGAWNGKVARPLAKNNLFVEVDELPPPDWREITIACALETDAENAYGQWPMGTDGLFTTKNPEEAIKIVNKYGLKAKVIGQIKQEADKTGVQLHTFSLGELPSDILNERCRDYAAREFNGKVISFTGLN